MEYRKLIQHGMSSLTLALPSKWLKDYGLKKGDTLAIKPEGKHLIVGTEEGVQIDKVSVDLTDLDRTSILLYIQSLYRFGYDEIEIKFEKPSVTHYRIDQPISVSSTVHKIVNRLIGAEIVEETERKILVKYITKEAEEDFKVILRRIFLLMKETSTSLIEGIKKNDLNLISTIEDKHDNINKFVNYSLRLLNKYGYPDVKKTTFYYHIIASVDKIVDILKYVARDVLKYKIKFNEYTINILEQINRSINVYYDLFYSFDLEKIKDLSRNRDHVKNNIRKNIKKFSEEELIQLTSMKQILEIILDLTDFRMGLEH